MSTIQGGQQWPAAITRQTLQLLLNRHPQPHYVSAAGQALAVSRIEHCATAGGNQVAFARAQGGQGITLTAAKAWLAFKFENSGDRNPELLFDPLISVDKMQAEAIRNTSAYRCFARAHRADKGQIGSWIHQPMLAFALSQSILSTMLRFFLLFVILLVGLFGFRITNFASEHFTVPFTGVLAKVSGWIIMLFDANVATEGVVIRSLTNGFAVGIAPGCDGIEAVIILVAAVLAFPAPWKHKLAGLVIGFFAIQALNLVRIISLFYMGQYSQIAFD